MKKLFSKLFSKQKSTRPLKKKSLNFQLETLEPRIMLSADPVYEEFYNEEVIAVEVAQMVQANPAPTQNLATTVNSTVDKVVKFAVESGTTLQQILKQVVSKIEGAPEFMADSLTTLKDELAAFSQRSEYKLAVMQAEVSTLRYTGE